MLRKETQAKEGIFWRSLNSQSEFIHRVRVIGHLERGKRPLERGKRPSDQLISTAYLWSLNILTSSGYCPEIYAFSNIYLHLWSWIQLTSPQTWKTDSKQALSGPQTGFAWACYWRYNVLKNSIWLWAL